MNREMLKGSWTIAKGKLKERYAQLTDDDLMYIEGRESELLGRVQSKVGATRDEIIHVLCG